MFIFIKKLFGKAPMSTPEQDLTGVSEIPNLDTKTAFQGDLSVVTIENLMQLMGHAGLSGELCLSTSDNHACFIIRNGALVFGHMRFNLPKMGERLVQAGYITIENLHNCLQLYNDEGCNQRLGELLVAKEFILDSQLEEIIKEQIKDCFFKVLSWNHGTFTFCVDESNPEEDILLDERIDYLIIEGIIALDDHNS